MGARIKIRSSQAQVALWPLAGIVPGPSPLQKASWCATCWLGFLSILCEAFPWEWSIKTPIKVTHRKLMNLKKLIYSISWICSPQVKDVDFEGLFGNIESVLETSQKLLKNLENAVQDKEGNDQELGNDWALVMTGHLTCTDTFF